MHSTGNNDLRQNGSAGVAERETGDAQDPFAATYGAIEDEEKDKTDAEEQRPGHKRKRLTGAAIFFLILIAAGAVMVRDGVRALTADVIDQYLCFLGKRHKELLNLRQGLARLETATRRSDKEIDEWVERAFAHEACVLEVV